MEKSSKDLQFLNTARDYRRWRLWFTYYVKGLGLEEHLTEVAVPTEAENRKKFLKERSQLLATVFRCVGLRFTPLIEGKTTVAEILAALDKNFAFTKFEEIEDLERKFDQLQFKDDPTRLFTHIRSLINQYKNLGGTLDEHQLARKVMNIFPEDVHYTPVKLLLKREAKSNGNKYKLENVLSELEQIARVQAKQMKKHTSVRRKYSTTFKQTTFKRKLIVKAAKC